MCIFVFIKDILSDQTARESTGVGFHLVKFEKNKSKNINIIHFCFTNFHCLFCLFIYLHISFMDFVNKL